jgi:hypothetical protein
MKSAALMLVAVLLLFLSPALALEETVVVVEEEPAVLVQKRLTTLVEEEPAAPIHKASIKASIMLVQEEPDAPAQPEPEPPEQQPPDAAQQQPEEQAQPEPEPEAPPAQQEQQEQPDDPPQQQEPPAPMPQAPEMPMRRPSDPGSQQASATPVRLVAAAPVRIVATAPAQLAAAAPVRIVAAAPAQQAFTAPAEQEPAAPARDYQQSDPSYLSEIASDFRYTVNNTEADMEDVVTAPLHVGEAGSLFVEPAFYYTVLGAGAALGGAFALDQTARAHVRHMGNSTADGFETGGNFFVYSSSGLLYLWGLQSENSNLREHEITGLESSGIASLITIGFKDGFGRLRPHQGHGHFAFFDNGDSFVSGAATPVFALAAATSEAYDNAWYVAIPAYAGAIAVGVGRMGKDDHWLSDIVGSAILGIGTTELLLYMHRWHAANPSRFRIFPVSAPNPGPAARQSASQGLAPQGLGVSYEW